MLPRISAIIMACCLGIPRLLLSQDSTRTDSTRADSSRTDSSRVTTLKTIEVTGSIAPTAGPVIGSGIPARISTVTGQTIEAWEPRLLPDALGTQAGISLYDDLGSPFKLNLSTRGFNVGPVVGLPPGVSVFLDGVRQNEPDAAEVNFDLLPMEHIQRVELLSGSGSLLGPNSLGGAINLITRRGSGPLQAEAELSGGSYGSYSGEASVDGGSGGDGLLRRRWLRKRGRLAPGHRSREPERFPQPGAARAQSGHQFAGVRRRLSGGNGGLIAGEHLRCHPERELHHRRLRGSESASGITHRIYRTRQQPRKLHRVRPAQPCRAVQRQSGARQQRALLHQ